MSMRTHITILAVLASVASFAQTLVSDFSIPLAACLQENILLVNQSTNATRYEWDVCQGDLALSPTGSLRGNLTGSSIPLGIDVVFDGTTWFGFATSRNTNSIYRFTFGSSLESITSVVNLGNIGSLLTQPVEIKIVTDNGKWYGFISNQSGSVSTSLITRIDFGTSLTNPSPTATSLIDDVTFAGDAGLDIVRSGTEWFLLYNQIGLGPVYQTGVARLATIETIPGVGDKLSIPYSGTPSIKDVKIIKNSTGYHAYVVVDAPSKLFHIDFGADIFTTPTPIDVSSVLPPNLTLYGVDGEYDNGNFYLFLSSDQGAIVRVNLGSDLTQNPLSAQNIGTLGVFTNNRKLRLVKDKTQWYAFSVDWSSGNILSASFAEPACAVAPGFFTTTDLPLQFTTSGDKFISLRSFQQGEYSDQHKSISIGTLQAPSLDFANTGICRQTPVGFTILSDQTITSSNWDFGDGNQSAIATPTNLFASTGSYAIALAVQAQNGCKNFKQKTIKIYNPPISNFTSLTGTICTNNEFTFRNTTVDDFDGNLTYQWLVNTEEVSTDLNLLFTFESGGAKNITLQASIPGCADDVTLTIPSVDVGPVADFTITGKCLNETIGFINNSLPVSPDAIVSQVWNFGDSQTSTTVSPTHVYPSATLYPVELAVTSTNGCVSRKIVNHRIYSVPQPNFTIDLPPFSCNGSSTNFLDLTPALTDSNIETWFWNFDDQGATSSNKTPQHTYAVSGQYEVVLTLTSGQSCTGTVTKTIAISEAPAPVIANTPACEDVTVEFIDASNATATEWMWQIGDNFYFTESPSHVFTQPATYSSSLIITAANGCIGSASKQITVQQTVSFDFESEKKCVDTESVFTAIDIAAPDAVVEYNWQFDGVTREGNTTGYSFATEGLHEVRLSILTQSGCEYTLNKAITVLPAPLANFTFTPQSGQPPLLIQFTNQSTNASSFQWSFNDALNSTSTDISPEFTFTELGNYPVDLLVSNAEGCEKTISKLVAVEVPNVSLSIRDLQILQSADGTLQILVSIENVGNVAAQNLPIELTLSNGTRFREVVEETINRGETTLHTFSTVIFKSTNISYLCTSIAVAGNASNAAQSICQALEARTIINAPYPNPATDELIIEWVSASEEEVGLTIINQQGKEVFTQSLSALPGLNQYQIDIQSVQSGLYLIKMYSSSAEQTFRTVIAK